MRQPREILYGRKLFVNHVCSCKFRERGSMQMTIFTSAFHVCFRNVDGLGNVKIVKIILCKAIKLLALKKTRNPSTFHLLIT